VVERLEVHAQIPQHLLVDVELGIERPAEARAPALRPAVLVNEDVGLERAETLLAHLAADMVAGTANSPSVAEQAMHFMFALAKHGAELNAMVKANRWGDRFKTLPIDLIDKTLLIS